jgi:hypothetical protein
MCNGKRRCRPVLVALALALALGSPPAANAKTFSVPCDDLALQSVLETANSNGEEDVVWLAEACVYAPAATLAVDDDDASPLTIHGRGATISGSGARPALVVNPIAILYLEGVTVSGGANPGDGGAIRNFGALTLTGSKVSGSEAARGAGIFNFDGAQLTLIRSTVSGNTASDDGGGIYNRKGRLTLLDSTVSANTAQGSSGNGGGIYSGREGARATITNSTVSGNSSRFGAGVFSDEGAMRVSHTTFSGNTTLGGGNGAGIYYRNYFGAGVLELSNNLVADNLSVFDNGYDCVRDPSDISITTAGGNLIEDGSCEIAGALSGDPLLGSPGGDPAHFPLRPGSPAIDAGGSSHCAGVDQRGEPRPKDGDHDGTAACDLGAYEAP